MPPTPFRQHPRAALLAVCLAAAAPAAAQNEHVTLLSRLHTKTAYSGLWGHTAADGREFALVGELNGTWIVDVSEPRFPKEIAHTVVGFHVRLDEAQSHGLSIFEYAPRDRGALAMAALAEELEARGETGAAAAT